MSVEGLIGLGGIVIAGTLAAGIYQNANHLRRGPRIAISTLAGSAGIAIAGLLYYVLGRSSTFIASLAM